MCVFWNLFFLFDLSIVDLVRKSLHKCFVYLRVHFVMSCTSRRVTKSICSPFLVIASDQVPSKLSLSLKLGFQSASSECRSREPPSSQSGQIEHVSDASFQWGQQRLVWAMGLLCDVNDEIGIPM